VFLLSQLDFLTDRPVAYHPILAKAFGGVKAGVFLSQLLYWMPRGRIEGWVYKTQAEFEAETGLTRREQDTARKSLRDCGVVIEELRGSPPVVHYQVDVGALEDALSYLAETDNSIWRKAPNQDGGKRQILPLRTESTPESTHGEPTQGSLDSEDPKPWPDWYATLYSIPGFKFPLDHCQLWMDEHDVPADLAVVTAYSVKSKWPGTRARPIKDGWLTFMSWTVRAIAERPKAPEPPQRRPSGFGGG
jgi:hypothetical protein